MNTVMMIMVTMMMIMMMTMMVMMMMMMQLIVSLGAHGVVHHHPEQENLRSCRSKSRNTRKKYKLEKSVFFCKKFLLLGLAIGHSQRQRVFMI